MSQNILKTRIVLNNLTEAEWLSDAYNSRVTLKGEVCIYSDLRKIKIGDGVNTITDLTFANLTPEEIQSLIKAASHTHSNFDVINATTASFTTELLTKLNGIANGAEVNQNAFSKITVGSTTIEADTKTDTLTLEGSNVTITPDVTNDKITIESTASGGSYVGSSAPSDTNLLWLDTSNSGILKYYDGTKWVEIAGLAEILDSMQSYLTRAQALYDSMYLDCDGETPNLRVVTLIKIKGGTPQQRLIDGGISFDGGIPTSRLLGA